MDFEVVYSAALERAGQCNGLSSYIGPSILCIATQERDAPGKITGLQAAARKVQIGPRPSFSEVQERLGRGYTLRSVARHYQISTGVIRGIVRTGLIRASVAARKPVTVKLPLEAA